MVHEPGAQSYAPVGPQSSLQEDKALPYKQPVSKSSSIETQKEKERIQNQNYILLPVYRKLTL